MVGAIAKRCCVCVTRSDSEERASAQLAKSTLELTISTEPDNNKKHLTSVWINHQSERGVWHTGVGEKVSQEGKA
jgi:hypothetical protein